MTFSYTEMDLINEQMEKVFRLALNDGMTAISRLDIENYLNQLDDWKPGCGREGEVIDAAIEDEILVPYGDEGLYALGDEF